MGLDFHVYMIYTSSVRKVENIHPCLLPRQIVMALFALIEAGGEKNGGFVEERDCDGERSS